MFDNSHCSECEKIDCLTRCQWIDIDKEAAKIEMDKIINGCLLYTSPSPRD